ncbi:MAG TPA: hypothetical protein VMK65_10740 [Longimicrobiales bacterium]|nr:hypothetical protein [Longimicrobiales bacterium]
MSVRTLMVVPMFALVGFVMAAPAQSQVGFGAQVSYASDFDLGIGARAVFGLGSMLGQTTGRLATLQGIVSADFFMPDCDPADCSYIEVNGNGVLPIALEGSALSPYVGAGLNFARISSEFGGQSHSSSEIGLNILGGTYFGMGGMNLFGEARYELAGGEQLVFSLGVLFGGSD